MCFAPLSQRSVAEKKGKDHNNMKPVAKIGKRPFPSCIASYNCTAGNSASLCMSTSEEGGTPRKSGYA